MKKTTSPTSTAAPTDALRLARLACRALEEKKGADIVALDVRGLSDITDFHVLVSGSSPPHLKALHGAAAHAFKQHGFKCWRKAGDPESGWMILDYGHIVVHVFLKETRDYYALEKLWASAPRLDRE